MLLLGQGVFLRSPNILSSPTSSLPSAPTSSIIKVSPSSEGTTGNSYIRPIVESAQKQNEMKEIHCQHGPSAIFSQHMIAPPWCVAQRYTGGITRVFYSHSVDTDTRYNCWGPHCNCNCHRRIAQRTALYCLCSYDTGNNRAHRRPKKISGPHTGTEARWC